jgi:serine/threonine-protein kinase HipA
VRIRRIAGESRGEQLEGWHWQRFARECGLNPRQVVDRVSSLAKSALAKAEEAAAEVAVMPAGTHAILDQIKEAVQRRATTLLEQLQKIGEATPLETVEG